MAERAKTTVTLIVPGPLRPFSGGCSEVSVDAATVAELFSDMAARDARFTARVLLPDGGLRPLVNVYVDKEDIRNLDGLETQLHDGAIVSIIPAIAGG
jgi:molybdopterin converting factor small subunit